MGLAYALDRALNVPKGRPLVHNLLLSFVMLPVISILLMIAIALPIAICPSPSPWRAFTIRGG